MKNRIFCYEKTIETKKTRKNALKTQCFNTFAYKNNQKITKTMQILHAIRRREAARFGTCSINNLQGIARGQRAFKAFCL